ncbi:DUF2721 domain-containing protein [Roseomonas sp. NAR14]|uniref:DUF2721 domain-containing protein n=1 Tax=Roseomonas acroporae TaxID=2937791 RepID=A0A9X2BS98_9PROT|nr:DUF2721 domain-containing protein [Roseomonas acroporae]MCK8783343.1 DUF2721 domain-containing protein [Roseomonas acroporae]
MAGELTSALRDVAELERTIQLAIAPAFLISALMTAVNVLVGRLARLVDRSRAMRAEATDAALAELERLGRRIRLTYYAIFACVASAILIGLLIIVAFVGALSSLPIGQLVGLLLIGAMIALILALCLFLSEIRLAARQSLAEQDV